jgi:hypothetical protein
MSQDVRMFCYCSHVIDDEVYEEDKCPRCYGKNYYFDIHFDNNGQAVLSENTLKLQQELLKITLEEKGDNPFFEEWGNEVRKRIVGSKNTVLIKTRIEMLVKDCLEYLKSVQMGNQNYYQNMDNEEIIATIESINVIPTSQVGYDVQVVVTSQAGENIAFEFSIEL